MIHGESIHCVVISPDGRLAASGGVVRQCETLVCGDSRGGLRTHAARELCLTALAFSPDGTKVVSGSIGADKTARLWSTMNGNPVGNVMRAEAGVMDIAFSPDGQRILTGAGEGVARLWSAENGEPIGLPMRHEGSGWVNFVEFSPNGDRLLTVAVDSPALLWADRPHPLRVCEIWKRG